MHVCLLCHPVGLKKVVVLCISKYVRFLHLDLYDDQPNGAHHEGKDENLHCKNKDAEPVNQAHLSANFVVVDDSIVELFLLLHKLYGYLALVAVNRVHKVGEVLGGEKLLDLDDSHELDQVEKASVLEERPLGKCVSHILVEHLVPRDNGQKLHQEVTGEVVPGHLSQFSLRLVGQGISVLCEEVEHNLDDKAHFQAHKDPNVLVLGLVVAKNLVPCKVDLRRCEVESHNGADNPLEVKRNIP